jgi:hypothetical protein
MGLYFNWPDKYTDTRSKQLLAAELGMQECTLDAAREAVDTADKAVAVWVSNGAWDALAYAYSRRELDAFTIHDGSRRPKKYYILDKAVAEANAK